VPDVEYYVRDRRTSAAPPARGSHSDARRDRGGHRTSRVDSARNHGVDPTRGSDWWGFFNIMTSVFGVGACEQDSRGSARYRSIPRELSAEKSVILKRVVILSEARTASFARPSCGLRHTNLPHDRRPLRCPGRRYVAWPPMPTSRARARANATAPSASAVSELSRMHFSIPRVTARSAWPSVSVLCAAAGDNLAISLRFAAPGREHESRHTNSFTAVRNRPAFNAWPWPLLGLLSPATALKKSADVFPAKFPRPCRPGGFCPKNGARSNLQPTPPLRVPGPRLAIAVVSFTECSSMPASITILPGPFQSDAFRA